MKSRLPLVIFAVAMAALSGCALPSFQKLDAQIPDGNWEQARVGVAGKFTSTTLDAKGIKENGKWQKGEIHFSHTNPWVTSATIDLKVRQ